VREMTHVLNPQRAAFIQNWRQELRQESPYFKYKNNTISSTMLEKILDVV
jgi:hypothetical protein